MSVNVRWNGRGWPGKVPRSPVASPEKAKEQGNWYGKDSRPKGTVKSRMAKNGNGKFKKKKKKKKKVLRVTSLPTNKRVFRLPIVWLNIIKRVKRFHRIPK
jgi:hypothetical protein